LQAAKRAIVESIDDSPYCGHGRRAQRLDRRPPFIAHGARMKHDEPRQVNAPSRGRRRVESLPTINHHQLAPFAAGFTCAQQTQRDGERRAAME
jgi:hypothetical protein